MSEPCYWLVRELDLKVGWGRRLFRIDVRSIPYRHGISLDAFFRKKRNWNGDKFLYTFCPEEEHNETTPALNSWRNVEPINIKTVAELFEKIGYNRKEKRFLTLLERATSGKRRLPKDPTMLMSPSGTDEPFRF